MTALWACLLATAFAAMAYGLFIVRRQHWLSVGAVALGTEVLINLTADNISPTWHTIRFWVSCALVAVFLVSFGMNARAGRNSHSRASSGT